MLQLLMILSSIRPLPTIRMTLSIGPLTERLFRLPAKSCKSTKSIWRFEIEWLLIFLMTQVYMVHRHSRFYGVLCHRAPLRSIWSVDCHSQRRNWLHVPVPRMGSLVLAANGLALR